MSNTLRKGIWFNVVLVTTLAVPLVASGQYGYTQRDRALLPEYCKYTPGERNREGASVIHDKREIARWNSLLGPTFAGLHHYCWGLMATNKAAVARTKQERHYLLDKSVKEFDYVLQRATPDFVLLPEILTKKGHNLIRLREPERGVQELERAIEVKPDYWPAYTVISDYFRDAGEPRKARGWVEKGLAVAPQVGALQRRLSELEHLDPKHKAARGSDSKLSNDAALTPHNTDPTFRKSP